MRDGDGGRGKKEESADTLSMLMFKKLSRPPPRPPHFIPPSIHLFVSPSSSPSHILFCVFTGAALEKEGEMGRKGRVSGGER